MKKLIKKINVLKLFLTCFGILLYLGFVSTVSHAATMPTKLNYTEYIKAMYELSSQSEQELQTLIESAKKDYASRYTPYVDIEYALGRTTNAAGEYIYYTGNDVNINDIGGNLIISDDIDAYMENIGLSVGSRANESNGSYKNAIQYLPIMQKYGAIYGVDPYLALAVACQESSGRHDASTFRENAGCGIMQIEAPGKVITSVTAYNYETNQIDTFPVTYAEMTEPDADKNIRAGIMNLASKLSANENNIYITIQAYNYGSGGIKNTVELYIKEESVSKTYNEIKIDSTILGWMGYRRYIHEDPGKYIGSKYDTGYQCRISDCPNKGCHASGSTYGDPFYVERILSYYHQANVT